MSQLSMSISKNEQLTSDSGVVDERMAKAFSLSCRLNLADLIPAIPRGFCGRHFLDAESETGR